MYCIFVLPQNHSTVCIVTAYCSLSTMARVGHTVFLDISSQAKEWMYNFLIKQI